MPLLHLQPVLESMHQAFETPMLARIPLTIPGQVFEGIRTWWMDDFRANLADFQLCVFSSWCFFLFWGCFLILIWGRIRRKRILENLQLRGFLTRSRRFLGLCFCHLDRGRGWQQVEMVVVNQVDSLNSFWMFLFSASNKLISS